MWHINGRWYEVNDTVSPELRQLVARLWENEATEEEFPELGALETNYRPEDI